jgi:hypothetical protein
MICRPRRPSERACWATSRPWSRGECVRHPEDVVRGPGTDRVVDRVQILVAATIQLGKLLEPIVRRFDRRGTQPQKLPSPAVLRRGPKKMASVTSACAGEFAPYEPAPARHQGTTWARLPPYPGTDPGRCRRQPARLLGCPSQMLPPGPARGARHSSGPHCAERRAHDGYGPS